MSNSVRRNGGAAFLSVCGFAVGTVFGQDVPEGSRDRSGAIPVELFVFDYPFNFAVVHQLTAFGHEVAPTSSSRKGRSRSPSPT